MTLCLKRSSFSSLIDQADRLPALCVKKFGTATIFCCFLGIDLQNVNITLRILHRPVEENLPKLYQILGVDYDERVLPSIANEVLKAVVVS